MKNNPVIPYILILAFGIGLIFFLSVEGVGNKEEIAADHAETTTDGGTATEGEATTGGETTDGGGEALDGAALTTTCIGCHGNEFQGGMGPQLAAGGASGKVDAARIEDVLVNGIAGTPMTPGMKTPEEAKAIAEYITTNFK